MSDQPPPPEPPARPRATVPTAPAAIRRSRPKPLTRTHPPVKRTLRDYWVMFCERWYWGLLPALIIAGFIAYQHLTAPPLFTSSAKLQLKPRNDDTGTLNLASYVEQMRSASFRERIAATFTPEEIVVVRRPYLEPGQDPAQAPDAKTIVARTVEITPAPEAGTIEVTVTHRDVEGAELIAGRYLRCFIEFSADSADTDLHAALQRLAEQERGQQLRIEEAERALQAFREAHPGVLVADNRRELHAQRVAALNEEVIRSHNERVELETALAMITEAGQQHLELARHPYIARYRGVQELLSEIDRLQAERALLERKYLENHPKIKANQLEIDARTGILRKNIEEAIAELRTKHAAAVAREERLLADQKAALAEQDALGEAGPAHRELEQRLAAAREQYARLEQQRNDLLLARGTEDVAVSILNRASAAQPVRRDLTQPILRGGALAFVLFLLVPVAFGLADTRLKAAWEVEQFLKENLLGEMPSLDGVQRKMRPHIMARDLDHGAAEAFRGLFGQLQLNSTVPYPKLFMLTSTLPGEGKSVIANNLAATFAGHGKKTLLVDCDFRRPNLHVYYGKDNACGVMRWLENNEAPKGPVLTDEDLGILPLQENFYLLRAGGESRRATELFEMDAFARLLAALRAEFDIVLMDTPPIGIFPDSMLLSRLIDEIAFICRFNAVNRSKIRKCLERLRTPNAVLAGIILNGIPSGKQSAHYDYYGYGTNETKRYKAYYAQRRT